MKISVFITSFNQKNYLVEAIDSVLNQTLMPHEIIIVDDCSVDGSQKIIESYKKKYPGLIRPFYHDKNIGIPRNKSFAMEQVTGNFVTYLDGDDRFLPEKLEIEAKTLKNNKDAKIVFSNFFFIDGEGKRLELWHKDGETGPPVGNVFREAFARAFPTGNLFRNELVDYQALKKTGFYDKDLAMYHDWDLRIRLTKEFHACYCHEALSEYRVHSSGISRRGAEAHLNEFQKVYAKNKQLLQNLPSRDKEFINNCLVAYFSKFSLSVLNESIRHARLLDIFMSATRLVQYKFFKII